MKILLLLIFSLIALQVTAQEYKAYYDQKGKKTDSANAETYNLTLRISDSLWYSKEYTINENILSEGTFLDKELRVAHGQFKFYSYSQGYSNIPVLGGNYLKLTGEFYKGLKTGRWTTYFPDGHYEVINTFKNNLADGLYERYNMETYKINIRGFFLQDLRDGEWSLFDKHGQIYQIETYKKDKLISTKNIPSSILPSVRTKDFDNYLKEYLSPLIIPKVRYVNILVSVKVTEQGRLITAKSELIRRGTSTKNSNNKVDINNMLAELSPAIEKIIMESPYFWKPAYNKKTKTSVQESSTFVIVVNKARLEITDIPALHKMPPEILAIN